MPDDGHPPEAPSRRVRRSVARLGPDPVDLHVGTRLRLRRVLLGLSQTQLAESVGLSFQQVQKYERASNRVSASMLYHLAEALDVPIGFFFDGMSGDALPVPLPKDPGGAHWEVLSVMRHWSAIPRDIRRAVCDLIKCMGRTEHPPA